MTLTTNGKLHIKRYMAGLVPVVAQSIAFGIGTAAESANSTKLQFEAGRTNVTLTSLDLINNRIVYKATLPENFEGTIYEVAIYSAEVDVLASGAGSRLITTFDSAAEAWVQDGTETPSAFVGGRIGSDALAQNPAAGATRIDAMSQVNFDFSAYSGADKFVFAFNCANGNAASVKWRFHTDASNYYEFSVGAQTAGYKIVEFLKSAATATGAPSWSSITQIKAITTSAAGGSASVSHDGIRLDDEDTINPDYVMVARDVLTTPYLKTLGRVQDIEFTLGITA